MKRSEVLKIIKSNLYHLDSCDPEADRLSNMILTDLEESGILTPEIVTKRTYNKLPPGMSVAPPLVVKGWEPEDE